MGRLTRFRQISSLLFEGDIEMGISLRGRLTDMGRFSRPSDLLWAASASLLDL
jgi:hypothetical protein